MGLGDKGRKHLREGRQRSRTLSRTNDAVAMKGAPSEQGASFASPRAQGKGPAHRKRVDLYKGIALPLQADGARWGPPYCDATPSRLKLLPPPQPALLTRS
jgi:hypothetical protein